MVTATGEVRECQKKKHFPHVDASFDEEEELKQFTTTPGGPDSPRQTGLVEFLFSVSLIVRWVVVLI